MVNKALRVIALWLTVLFCLAWWPAAFAVLALGCLWLADTRERNQSAADANAEALLPLRTPKPERIV